MDWTLYLAFIAATVALAVVPGPNVALIIANSVAYGRRYGLITVAGTSSALIPMLALTAASISAAVSVAALFDIIRWIGVAYLIYLAISTWRAPALDLSNVKPDLRSAKGIFLRGVIVSVTNPKSLMFYAAFFPQFVTPGLGVGWQLAILCTTFFVLVAALDSCWAIAAGAFRKALAVRATTRNRLSASFYLAAATGLAIAR